MNQETRQNLIYHFEKGVTMQELSEELNIPLSEIFQAVKGAKFGINKNVKEERIEENFDDLTPEEQVIAIKEDNYLRIRNLILSGQKCYEIAESLKYEKRTILRIIKRCQLDTLIESVFEDPKEFYARKPRSEESYDISYEDRELRFKELLPEMKHYYSNPENGCRSLRKVALKFGFPNTWFYNHWNQCELERFNPKIGQKNDKTERVGASKKRVSDLNFWLNEIKPRLEKGYIINDIAKETGYSRAHIFKIKRNALKKMEANNNESKN